MYCCRYDPGAGFVDPDLLQHVRVPHTDQHVGKGSQVVGFHLSRCHVRRMDGARVYAQVAGFAVQLHSLLATGAVGKATKLCRHVQVGGSWGCSSRMKYCPSLS